MALPKKGERGSKVYVNMGKIPGKKKEDGKPDNSDLVVAMSEEFAILVGATYTRVTPEQRTVTFKKGKLAGRSYKREIPITLTHVRYRLGYVAGIRTNTTTKKKEAVIRWVPLTIPSGTDLKVMLGVVRKNFKKRPVFLETPSGNRTRFVSNTI